MNIEFEYDYLPPFTLHAFSRFSLISWCPRRSPPRKSPTICLSSQPLQATNPPPPSPSFCQSHKIVEGGRNYTKILLSSGEEKHVDIYIYIYIYWRLVPCQLFLHSEELLHHLLFLALVSLLCLKDVS